MNMIDKIMDSQSLTGPNLGQPCPVMISLPDFRTRPAESFLNASSAGYFPDNLFLLNPSLFSRALNPSSAFSDLNSNFKLPLINNPIVDNDPDKSSEEEDFCEKCQKRFCNKYYLRKHKIDVHKVECDLPNPIDSSIGDSQQKSSIFQPSIFNPLFSSSFSNFLLQKSIGPMFPNILLPAPTMPSSLSQSNSDFNLSSSLALPSVPLLTSTSSASNPSPVFSQSGFRITQQGPIIASTDASLSTNLPISFSNNLVSLSENCRLTNITTSIFDNVKNTFINLPLDSKSFPSLNSMENTFREQNKPMLQQQQQQQQQQQSVSCNICGIQLTGGDSVLLDHLFTCHNKENMNSQSSIPKLLPKNEPTPPANTTNDSYISPFDAFKSSMAAAKLADRVTCDICHKDLCNKYFLRTHKLKLHGVQTIDSIGRTGNRKEKTGFFDHCQNSIEQLNPNPGFIGTPFPRNPLPDPLLTASLFNNNTKPRPGSPETGCFCPICKRLISLPYFLPLHMWNAHGIGMGSHTSIMPSVCSSRSNLEQNILEPSFIPNNLQSKINPSLFPLSFCNNNIDTGMSSKWYRKSPNQMRVRCDICDKWICNKYFLRTHKLNKHGLTDNGSNTDVNSDSVSRNFFIDSSTVPNPSSTGTDPSDNHTNNPTGNLENDSSPIDLSASPIRTSNPLQNTITASIYNPEKPISIITSSQSMPGFNLSSLWSSRMNFPWPLRFSMDRLNLPSIINNNPRGSVPLDLSMKTEEIDNVKTENSCVKIESESNTYNYRSVLFNAAKRLKVKYQKIYRSRFIQNAFLTSRKNCQFLNHQIPSNGILDCLSCPLCGKELSDAASFLQHLTQFHDMVLPGSHSNPVADVC